MEGEEPDGRLWTQREETGEAGRKRTLALVSLETQLQTPTGNPGACALQPAPHTHPGQGQELEGWVARAPTLVHQSLVAPRWASLRARAARRHRLILVCRAPQPSAPHPEAGPQTGGLGATQGLLGPQGWESRPNCFLVAGGGGHSHAFSTTFSRAPGGMREPG